MQFDWKRDQAGSYVSAFEDGDLRGTISFRVTHDPETMQWRMRGRILGLGDRVIALRQRMPDDGRSTAEEALEMFKRTCEYDLIIYLAEVGR
jgi:hypothetical protein